MKVKEQIRSSRFGDPCVPKLHGHTKITLTDVKTGAKKVIEKDNLVTNAVANIYASNFFGAMDYTKVTPLKDMFGGVLCFEDELTELAANTLPPCEAENKLIAHAGQTAHSSASTTRGNPNGTLSGEIQNGKGYKFVWDFSTQVVGTISALALTHKWGGDIGFKPVEAVTGESLMLFNSNKTKVAIANSSSSQVDFETFYNAVISADLENETGIHVYLPSQSGTSLIVNEVQLRTHKQDINGDLGEASLIESHNVTLTRSFDRRYTAICTDGDYIYVIQANSNGGTTLYIDKISMSTWTATDISITEASLSLASVNMSSYSDGHCYPNRVVISDGYLFWAKSDLTTFYKINLATPADITELTSTLTASINEVYGQTEISDGLVIGANYIINGNRVYPMTVADREILSTTYAAVSQSAPQRLVKCGSKFLLWLYTYDQYYPITVYFGGGFITCYLATIQNLEQPVVKTSDMTMQIEYSITLAEET